MSTQPASQVPQLAHLNSGSRRRATPGASPVGQMTAAQAAAAVTSMVDLHLSYKGGDRLSAYEAAMDSIASCGRKAPSEPHRRDYRLMWREAQRMRQFYV